MLMCDDVPASIAFYTEVLGLEVEGRMDRIGRSGWASLIKGPVHVMLASPTYVPPGVKVDGRFPQSIYYFYVQGIEELHARARERGRRPTDIEQRFYDQREFQLVDPDGHVLVFGEHSPARPGAKS
jgi:uncharacterized glyoxalase superfamily protein PhnB